MAASHKRDCLKRLNAVETSPASEVRPGLVWRRDHKKAVCDGGEQPPPHQPSSLMFFNHQDGIEKW